MWALLAGETVEPQVPDWQAFLERFGLPLTLLVLVLVTGARGVWVWGTQLRDANERTAAAERELTEARAETKRLQDERLRDAQSALAGFGTRLYDAAQLIERGTRVVAEASAPDPVRDDLDSLRAEVRGLVDRLGDVVGRDEGPAGEGRPGDR